jgi:alpha-N-arabinofuranosidase
MPAKTKLPGPDTILVKVNRPGGKISSNMFGIFFEDINFAADGGLYPERVKNRSFEFTEPLAGWTKLEAGGAEGELVIRTDGALNKDNPHYLRLRVYNPGAGFGVTNSGLRGIGVQQDALYTFSAYVRATGNAPRTLRATLTDEEGRKTIGEAKLMGFGGEWKKYEASLRASATAARARLSVFVEEKGEIDLDMVSLFPRDTWKGRPNGLRKDLVQLLADLKPGFLRFPGGCIVEGRRLELRYRWKKTLGDVSERRSIVNRWNDEFAHRPTPDYFQSFGLGFFEYFQLAEDIGASPLPILNCGMACQFNSSETAAIEQTDEYIQDALDLIEFANGPVESHWGTIRAALGHREPFHLKMIGVGNEQWGPRYIERYRLFSAALKAKHPEIALVSSSGPSPEGREFDYLWSQLRELKTDLIDEHYYASPDWFLAHSGRYDHYDRSGPKVFAGEYAAQTSGVARPDNRNNWQGALAEAAFMTGLERNADIVRMASYAPLFAHVDAWQWTPNLIWFDNLRSYGTPNYYVQKLFSTNTGTRILPVAINGSAENARQGLYASASLDDRTGEVIVKVVNTTKIASPVRIALEGVSGAGRGRSIILESADLKAENSLDHPARLTPVESTLSAAKPEIEMNLGPYSVTVLRLAERTAISSAGRRREPATDWPRWRRLSTAPARPRPAGSTAPAGRLPPPGRSSGSPPRFRHPSSTWDWPCGTVRRSPSSPRPPA